jgi:translation initiation factor 4A
MSASASTTETTTTTTEVSSSDIVSYETFDDMGLRDDILRGIYSFGFEKPSAIQKVAILPVTQGKDVIAQAQSGTGKTGAFAIGLLQRIDPAIPHIQAIVVLPTRELADQVHMVVTSIGAHSGIKTVLAIGGERGMEQVRLITEGAHILIGTPGRIYDLITNRVGVQAVEQLKMMVIDEADEMLSEGFQDQIREIFQKIPQSAQVCLFSATLGNDVLALTARFMRSPVKILVKQDELTLDGIQQYYIPMREQDKTPVLLDLYETMSITQCMIYCNSRTRVEELAETLRKNRFTVGAIHGHMTWDDRNRIMKEFRTGHLRVLISTDLLARGIDVQQVSIVINYDIPREIPKYLHRIGRSGRYGRKGLGINFVTEQTWEQLRLIQDYYRTEIAEMPNDFMKHLTS